MRETESEGLADVLAQAVKRHMGPPGYAITAEGVRPAFVLALGLLEREGKIPGVAPELREVGEAGPLAELREWLRFATESARTDKVLFIAGPSHSYEYHRGRQEAFDRAVDQLDRIAERHAVAQPPIANRLKSALRLQGVDLGPDASEAIGRALAALEGGER